MFTFFTRTAKYALQDLWRNFWLSVITITVILLALFSFNSLVLVKTVSEYTLQTIEKKIDVSVFMNPDVEESIILDLRARLLGLEQVREVIYISSDESLQSMIEKHSDDPALIESISELDENPLGAQLIVQARSAADYDPIVDLLNDDRFDQVIYDKNFEENTIIIERVSSVSNRVRSIATAMTLLFTAVALIVVYNTLRIIIYTHKDEIAIMRLVGATTWFIRMPYIWQSIFYGLISMLVFLLIWYPVLGIIQPYVDELFVDTSTVNLVNYFNVNFLYLFGAELIGLIVLVSLASILATSKYSRV
jgi:cell division transport system permease protein